MYIPLDFINLIDVVEECNSLRNSLEAIKELAEKADESDFEKQSKLIAIICNKALENKPKILSKTKSELLEDCEYHIESILSGEWSEQFQT
ncbi:MAG: hypothetical protein MUC29_13255 [Pyrinomonadaceae bacterium]|jgi:hypothetical protein|nr:hypothetical protein [Pyrinomonadaceae bacterium]